MLHDGGQFFVMLLEEDTRQHHNARPGDL